MEDIHDFDHLACLCQTCMASSKIRSISAEHWCGSGVLKAWRKSYNKPWYCPELHNIPSDTETQLSGLSQGSRIWSLALCRARTDQVIHRVLTKWGGSSVAVLATISVGPVEVSFFSSQFASFSASPLLKPTEVHSHEVYHTFLVAGHFLSPLFHSALHKRFHWLLSRSDIAYQIKYNHQFFLQELSLYLLCLWSASQPFACLPFILFSFPPSCSFSTLRTYFFLKYRTTFVWIYQNPLPSILHMLNAVPKVRLWWCQTLPNPFLQLLSHCTNCNDLFQTSTPPSALFVTISHDPILSHLFLHL